MPFRAGFPVTKPMVLALGVFAGSDDFEMGWIAAGTVSAEVVELHTFGDFLVVFVLPEDSVDYSVWLAWSLAVFAVSVGGFGAGPYPAFVLDADFAFDSGEFAGVHSPVLHAQTIQELT